MTLEETAKNLNDHFAARGEATFSFAVTGDDLQINCKPGEKKLWQMHISKLGLPLVTSENDGGISITNMAEDRNALLEITPEAIEKFYDITRLTAQVGTLSRVVKDLLARVTTLEKERTAAPQQVKSAGAGASAPALPSTEVAVPATDNVVVANFLLSCAQDKANGRDTWNNWREAHPQISITHIFLRMAHLEGYNLRGLEIKGHLTNAHDRDSITGGSMEGAVLRGTDLRGANLELMKGLTLEQLALATLDTTTKLPAGLTLDAIEQERINKVHTPAPRAPGIEQILAERGPKAAEPATRRYVNFTVNTSEQAALDQAVQKKIEEGKNKDNAKPKKEKEEVSDAEVLALLANYGPAATKGVVYKGGASESGPKQGGAGGAKR